MQCLRSLEYTVFKLESRGRLKLPKKKIKRVEFRHICCWSKSCWICHAALQISILNITGNWKKKKIILFSSICEYAIIQGNIELLWSLDNETFPHGNNQLQVNHFQKQLGIESKVRDVRKLSYLLYFKKCVQLIFRYIWK